MAASPTQFTLKLLREQGWMAAVVEYWGAFDHRRHDLFGFIDILAIRPGATLAVQACTTGDIQKRVRKMKALDALERCKDSGWTVQAWGWKKYAKPVDRKLWRPTIIAL